MSEATIKVANTQPPPLRLGRKLGLLLNGIIQGTSKYCVAVNRWLEEHHTAGDSSPLVTAVIINTKQTRI